jgi:hypothetical protein
MGTGFGWRFLGFDFLPFSIAGYCVIFVIRVLWVRVVPIFNQTVGPN